MKRAVFTGATGFPGGRRVRGPLALGDEVPALLGGASTVRALLGGLAVFDAVLGATAAFFPHTYVAIMHARFAELHPAGPVYLVSRTGAAWLFFALAEVVAARFPWRSELLFLVGALRWMDVPADLAYLCTADDLGAFGQAGLWFSPLFNALVGSYFIAMAWRRVSSRSPSSGGT